jgi:DNA helicase-2/ATP-dependent DNA helicase PcrA
MFIWDKGALNDEQEDAIKEQASVLLIACPGSGKTRALTYKIAYELSRLTSSKHYIIAITYTNAAADEIKERVEILGIDTSQLWIGTLHSFCLEWILKPYYLYCDSLKEGFKVINSHDTEVIVTDLCAPYKKYGVTYWDFNYYASIKGYQISSLDEDKLPYLKIILAEYHKILADNRQIDFEQILHYSYYLLKNNPAISAILSKIFPFILVDEYQDTKEIQYHIIAAIMKAGGGEVRTLIVGDPNQSIYDTLGGYPMPKNDMEKLFGFPLKGMKLINNYRSSKRIIEYFEYFRTFDNSNVASGPLKDYKSNITYATEILVGDLEDEIVKLIQLNVKTNGISPNEICIAAPQWIPLASLTRNLMVKLPDYSFDGPGMAPFSRDIDNFWYKVSRILLTEPSPDMYVKRLRWASEILNDLSFEGADVNEFSNKSLLKICNGIDIPERDGLKYLERAFGIIFRSLKLSISTFPGITEHYDTFFKSSTARIARLVKDGNSFVSTIENFRKVFKQREGIKISTIHGVKGTEFDVVIGFGLLNRWVPHFSDKNGSVNSKKMLYVLCSRARKNLHLISERGRNVNWHNPEGLSPTDHLENYSFKYD